MTPRSSRFPHPITRFYAVRVKIRARRSRCRRVRLEPAHGPVLNQGKVRFIKAAGWRHRRTTSGQTRQIAENPRVRRLVRVDVRVALRAFVTLEFVVEGRGIHVGQVQTARSGLSSVASAKGTVAVRPRKQGVNVAPNGKTLGRIRLLRNVRTRRLTDLGTPRRSVRTSVFLVVVVITFRARLIAHTDLTTLNGGAGERDQEEQTRGPWASHRAAKRGSRKHERHGASGLPQSRQAEVSCAHRSAVAQDPECRGRATNAARSNATTTA